MPAYAIAHLREVSMKPAIAEYLQKIDASLKPFKGRYLVHGGKPEVLEGEFPGHLIVIKFPDSAHARAWYHSAAYQEILPLRAENSVGDAFIVDGVAPNHRATDILTS